MLNALIVEDEPAANHLLSMLVKLRGYEIESAFTGDEALKKAEAGHPDVVFLDLMLPDISGYEVCRTLKDHRTTNTIPIVMVTARLAAENRIQGFRAGAVEYVPKPYTPDQIFEAMSRATTWRSRIGTLAASGHFAVKTSDEIDSLEHLSDLRSLLLTRTRLDEDSVRRIVKVVLEVCENGIEWAREHDRDHVATLSFQLDPGKFALTIHDESGWFGHDVRRRDGLSAQLSDGGIDRIEFRDGRDLTLTCDLPAD